MCLIHVMYSFTSSCSENGKEYAHNTCYVHTHCVVFHFQRVDYEHAWNEGGSWDS